EEERKTPTQTMAATRARKFLAGNHVGSAPTGGKVEEGVISFFPSWVPRIRRAFRLRAEGCTYSEIEEEIGIPQGKLNYMLHNPAYC
ncbi:hypothetical protein GWN63_01025, partial [Candidatus Bathyarchaeota archaeon]|nr:hypothetical protein [Candidatus Bathyarchaeota archaeon]NIU80820.1 hypothetical protein [Candidatus Bathyarchaeota archaeon]NIV67455.1 hypothetical protein [Candidatus Bathyarchaeota archaeon]